MFASGQNYRNPASELHTNFTLDSAGQYLAIVRRTESRSATNSKPQYPAAGGRYLVRARAGNDNTGRDRGRPDYLVPPGDSLGTTWTAIGFDDSTWTKQQGLGQPAVTGIGYNTQPNGLTVTLYQSTAPVNSLADAENVLADVGQQESYTTATATTLNYLTTGSAGRFVGDAAFPGLQTVEDIVHFVIEATGTIVIPPAGDWTFGVNSDDGFRLDLTNGAGNYSMSFDAARGPDDTLRTFHILQPGDYGLRLVYFQRTGGAELELFAAQGSHSAFAPGVFQLVGDVAHGGLAVTGFGGAIATNVQTGLQGVNSSVYLRVPFEVNDPAGFQSLVLRMKYNDGFVAYLNGQEIARQHAPAGATWNSTATASRSQADSRQFDEFPVTSALGLLVPGTNVLAVHGLNVSASDDDFLLLPELVAVATDDNVQFFGIPTPGGLNDAGYMASVADTRFDFDRGFYSQPFDLHIACDTPGATIVYTTDGSVPSLTNGTQVPSSAPTAPPLATIPLSRTTTLRAAAFKNGHQPTSIDTQTYIFLNDVLAQSGPPSGWPCLPSTARCSTTAWIPRSSATPRGAPNCSTPSPKLPTLSLVTGADNLFDPQDGIYVNALESSRDWERPTSLELIHPDGSDGFQIDAGLRIRGGESRNDANPKHELRILFRTEYGAANLDYPLFGDEGAAEFDRLELTTSRSYSWAYLGECRHHPDPRRLRPRHAGGLESTVRPQPIRPPLPQRPVLGAVRGGRTARRRVRPIVFRRDQRAVRRAEIGGHHRRLPDGSDRRQRRRLAGPVGPGGRRLRGRCRGPPATSKRRA